MRHSALLVLLLAGASNAYSQGTSCSAATPITNTGSWQWSGNGGSNQPDFSPGTACEFSAPGHTNRYFQWTAASAGTFQVDTFGSTWDTQLSLYSGDGCSATCLVHDYGNGSVGLGYHFGVSFLQLSNVQAGDTFLIRVGNLPDSHTPWITLNVSEYSAACAQLSADPFEPNNSLPEQYLLSDGTYLGLNVSQADPDYYTFCLPPGATVHVDLNFLHAVGNIDARLILYNGLQSSFFDSSVAIQSSLTDNETLTYTNPESINQEIRLAIYVNAHSSADACNDYSLVVSGTGNCMLSTETFCDPMDVNSTGVSTVLTGVPAPSADSGLRLEASQGPPGQFAYFLSGSAISEPGLSLGQGRFCLGLGSFDRYGRYNISGTDMNSLGRFQPSGVLANIVGTSSTGIGFEVPFRLPFQTWNNQPLATVSGQTWFFQLWHRDVGGQSNFSNGLSVTF